MTMQRKRDPDPAEAVTGSPPDDTNITARNRAAADRAAADMFVLVAGGALCSTAALTVMVDLSREVILGAMAAAGILLVAAALAAWRSRAWQKKAR